MSSHRWRGDPARLDGRRQWIRENFPSGSAGFVVEDLDTIIRCYKPGPMRYLMLEYKTPCDWSCRENNCQSSKSPKPISLGRAQKETFTILSQDLAHSPRFDGFYIVTTEHERLDVSEWVYWQPINKPATKLRNGIDELWEIIEFYRLAGDLPRFTGGG